MWWSFDTCIIIYLVGAWTTRTSDVDVPWIVAPHRNLSFLALVLLRWVETRNSTSVLGIT